MVAKSFSTAAGSKKAFSSKEGPKAFVDEIQESLRIKTYCPHHLVDQILDDEKVVMVIRMWSHYEYVGITLLVQGTAKSSLPLTSPFATMRLGISLPLV